MRAHSAVPSFRPIRRDELRVEREHDTYRAKGKLPEPAVCAKCGAVWHLGRWQWGAPPAGAIEVTCPACHRARDRMPCGYVNVSGDYFAAHRTELLALLRHHEQRERAEHPLARVLDIEDTPTGVLVTTTDIHLARNLGEALHKAHHGELEFHYNEGEKLLRVRWYR